MDIQPHDKIPNNTALTKREGYFIKFWNGTGDLLQEFIKPEDSSALLLQPPSAIPSSL